MYQTAFPESFALFLNAKVLTGLVWDRLYPDMEPTLILVTQRRKQVNRGACSCDDRCQTFDPIKPGERKFAASRKRPNVLRVLLQHNIRNIMSVVSLCLWGEHPIFRTGSHSNYQVQLEPGSPEPKRFSRNVNRVVATPRRHRVNAMPSSRHCTVPNGEDALVRRRWRRRHTQATRRRFYPEANCIVPAEGDTISFFPEKGQRVLH
jgi:hypothetical protein